MAAPNTYMIEEWGVIPNDTDGTVATANVGLIETAISDLAGQGAARLVFSERQYAVHGSITYDPGRDLDIKLTIQGTGRRGTRITQTDKTATTWQFINSTQNMRGLVMRDMWMTGTANGHLWMERCSYNLFENCTFMQSGHATGPRSAVTLTTGSHFDTFSNCWWVHNAGNAVRVANGSGLFGGCQFGEDSGALWVQDGLLNVSGSTLHQANDGAYGADTRAAIVVARDGGLVAAGNSFGQCQSLLRVNDAGAVVLSGNIINFGLAGRPLISVNEQPANTRFTMTGNVVTVSRDQTAAMVKLEDGAAPTDWTISGNAFYGDGGADSGTLTAGDADFFDPANRNRFSSNSGLPPGIEPAVMFGVGPPTSGAHNAGDRVVNSSPAEGPDHWVCITSGSPGTWASREPGFPR